MKRQSHAIDFPFDFKCPSLRPLVSAYVTACVDGNLTKDLVRGDVQSTQAEAMYNCEALARE